MAKQRVTGQEIPALVRSDQSSEIREAKALKFRAFRFFERFGPSTTTAFDGCAVCVEFRGKRHYGGSHPGGQGTSSILPAAIPSATVRWMRSARVRCVLPFQCSHARTVRHRN